MNNKTIYTSVTLIVIVLLAGLLWWYVYISNQQSALEQGSSTYYSSTSGGVGGSSSSSWFGSLIADDVQNAQENATTNTADTTQPVLTLEQLYNMPTAGVALGADNQIYFADIATGHVFQTPPYKLNVERVMENTIPKLITMTATAGGVVRRYIDDTDNIISVFTDMEGTNSVFADGAMDMAVSGALNDIFFLRLSQTGIDGVLFDTASSTQRVIWHSALRGWEPYWVGKHSVALTQKAANGIGGYAMVLNTTSGALRTLISGVTGLALTARGDSVLYSRADGDALSLFLRTDALEGDMQLSIKTIAEKCVIVGDGTSIAYCAVPKELPTERLPDAWYRGEVHTADALWLIDMQTGAVEQLLDPRAAVGIEMDMTQLSVSDDGSVLVFINRNNDTPWRFTRIEPEAPAEVIDETGNEGTENATIESEN